MPIAHIHLLEGRSVEQKQELIQNVTIAISQSLGASPEKVRVLLMEVSKENWGTGGVTKAQNDT
ncbi:4-oxalocrotonate tautomerase [Bacillus sp. LL01]|uniref:2-hydroxymuconate tautomerase n=1 Tax=Bacillus sp. LL01 TaxID=1665556 RepID=UPI00064D54F5|nr:2-hydroxymuconate tautomerase [Bacillus sp. LL01]KMJ59960.1 4-oxalocrotonate tautomerase [Bacillus sp. LL01]